MRSATSTAGSVTAETPGYQSLTIYLPSQQGSVVMLINIGGNIDAINLLEEATTRIITPMHVYEFVPIAQRPVPSVSTAVGPP